MTAGAAVGGGDLEVASGVRVVHHDHCGDCSQDAVPVDYQCFDDSAIVGGLDVASAAAGFDADDRVAVVVGLEGSYATLHRLRMH